MVNQLPNRKLIISLEDSHNVYILQNKMALTRIVYLLEDLSAYNSCSQIKLEHYQSHLTILHVGNTVNRKLKVFQWSDICQRKFCPNSLSPFSHVPARPPCSAHCRPLQATILTVLGGLLINTSASQIPPNFPAYPILVGFPEHSVSHRKTSK
jgi:hypothetical protein